MTNLEFNHISYSISYKELVSMWVDLYFGTENIVVIYDPVNHIKYLRNLDIELDEINLYEGKILAVHVVDVADAILLCGEIDHTCGPYAEVWSMGEHITDNIEK